MTGHYLSTSLTALLVGIGLFSAPAAHANEKRLSVSVATDKVAASPAPNHPYAVFTADQLKAAVLEEADRRFQSARPFDPETPTNTFVIASLDYYMDPTIKPMVCISLESELAESRWCKKKLDNAVRGAFKQLIDANERVYEEIAAANTVYDWSTYVDQGLLRAPDGELVDYRYHENYQNEYIDPDNFEMMGEHYKQQVKVRIRKMMGAHFSGGRNITVHSTKDIAMAILLAPETIEARQDELLSALADIPPRSRRRKSLVHQAIWSGVPLNIIQAAQGRGRDCDDMTDIRKQSPLWTAAWLGDADLSRYFIEQGCSVTLQNVNELPIVFAAAYGTVTNSDLSLIDMFLDNGADINATGPDGLSVLHVAIGRAAADDTGNMSGSEIVRALLARGALVDGVGGSNLLTPLQGALQEGQTNTAIALLQAGADPNRTTQDGTPVILQAVDNADARLVEALIDRGVDLSGVGTSRFIRAIFPSTYSANLTSSQRQVIAVLRNAPGLDAAQFTTAMEDFRQNRDRYERLEAQRREREAREAREAAARRAAQRRREKEARRDRAYNLFGAVLMGVTQGLTEHNNRVAAEQAQRARAEQRERVAWLRRQGVNIESSSSSSSSSRSTSRSGGSSQPQSNRSSGGSSAPAQRAPLDRSCLSEAFELRTYYSIVASSCEGKVEGSQTSPGFRHLLLANPTIQSRWPQTDSLSIRRDAQSDAQDRLRRSLKNIYGQAMDDRSISCSAAVSRRVGGNERPVNMEPETEREAREALSALMANYRAREVSMEQARENGSTAVTFSGISVRTNEPSESRARAEFYDWAEDNVTDACAYASRLRASP